MSTLMDSGRDLDTPRRGSSSGLLGFRATLPKLPSFRRKIAQQSTPAADRVRTKAEDTSDQSDQDEIVQQSESDEEMQVSIVVV